MTDPGAGSSARPLVGALALLVAATLAACGTPHGLPSVSARRVPASSPLARIEVRRPDSFATLDRLVAPEGRTVLVLVGPGCTRCLALLDRLAATAFGRRPFSVLVLEADPSDGSAPPPAVAQACVRLGLSRWSVPARSASGTPARVGPALGLAPADRSGVAVVAADGRRLGRWSGAPEPADAADIIEEARG
ncbi:hypothetical protein KSP35_19090 [Aquihabitans sp. G128]|uniref:hypothetical protein n=1 Tax=Aquihabitans sp. G128 TaxID=2849779 RepID=UPI001C242D4F|nr:hypothetical protein [Aquihabitans sp. G128]QXC60411.1 hypothetical protein KSP35_19090 [Aquihabitans sp. G128]